MRLLPPARLTLAAIVATACTLAGAAPSALVAQSSAPSATYAQLTALFSEWRTFEEPPRVNGIPDYAPATNVRRLAALTRLQQRLKAIDTTGWRIPEQVDLHVVRAEMNGLQYNLTVLTPWSRDPAYYASIRTEESDTPAEEGPVIHGAIRLWKYPIWPRTRFDTSRPLSPEQTSELAGGAARRSRPLLRQARINLARGNAKDLWVGAVKTFEEQHESLVELKKLLGATGDPALIGRSTMPRRQPSASPTG
ncbi:MAG: hypothetical protein U5K74_09295 [Gemmatimonadaceae bacterium]|nr:hypothetical protein [Gemmatimonadaceae bacterium]